jgi:hypothetical protein
MAAVGNGSEAHRHFLHDESHDKGEHDKRNEEADAVAGAIRGVGQHAGCVVFTEEDENSGADEKPEQAKAAEFFGTALGSRASYCPAVTSAIHILVSDETD